MTLDADRRPPAKLFVRVGGAFMVIATAALVILGLAGAILHRPRPSLWPPGWNCIKSRSGSGDICQRGAAPPRVEIAR